MSAKAVFAISGLVLLLAAPASAEGWATVRAGNGHGEQLTLALDGARSYIFECVPDGVVITETGVTDLLDIRGGGSKVGDAPGSTMLDGAAVMALYTGKGEPEFQPATYAANPGKGWDLTIRFAKGDKRLKALAKTEMLSLFTTGFTAAIPLGVPERKMFAEFLGRCAA
jgi:hypothetical protein